MASAPASSSNTEPALQALPADAAPHCRLYLLDTQADAAAYDDALDLLDANERRRFAQYLHASDARRFALTRAHLRRLLGQRLGRAPQTLCLHTGPYGKPLLADAPTLYFSVAHAGRHALIALSENIPVGVDIEALDAGRPLAALATQVFAPIEHARYGQPCGLRDFYTVWTAKEAVCKAWGCGIGEHLEALGVLPVADDARHLALHVDEQVQPGVRLWRLAAPEGYAAALCLAMTPVPDYLLKRPASPHRR